MRPPVQAHRRRTTSASQPPGEVDDWYGRLARRDPSDLGIHRRGSQTAPPRRPIWDNDHIVSSPLLRPTISADVTLCADGNARVIPFVLPLNVPEESMSMTVRDWLRLDEKTMMVGMLDQSAIIARIRALRLARGLTIQYLADQTGIHRSIIGKLERGKRKTFNLDEARALCDALKVDLRVVISDEPMSIIEKV
ncbi:helix-turn-helix domain-containing protein [Streptosporangium roseum]|uniref:helix-turn-helix domain-containing protein n=1 Tax=Streptosporangium roseum TaxID=2001 RepID=UPI00332F3CAE